MKYTKGLGEKITDKLQAGKHLGHSVRVSISEEMLNETNSFRERFGLSKLADFISAKKKITPPNFDRMIKSLEKAKPISSRGEYLKEKVGPAAFDQQYAPESTNKLLSFIGKKDTKEEKLFAEKQRFDETDSTLRDVRHKEVVGALMKATESKRKAEKTIKEQSLEEQKKRDKKYEITETKTESPKPTESVVAKVAKVAKKVVGVITNPTVVGTAIGTGLLIGQEIAKGESAGASYNAANMGTKNNKIVGIKQKVNLENMTVGEVIRRQSIKWGDKDEGEKLFAVGKYQVIPSTLLEAVKKLKIPLESKFDGALQEKIFKDYLLDVKRPAISKYLKSEVDDPNLLYNALKQLSLEWASVADPDIPGGKTSHYGSGNKASISVDQAATMLKADRERLKGKTNLPQVVSPTVVGEKINNMSSEHDDMIDEIETPQLQPSTIMNQTTNNLIQRNYVTPPATHDNTNPMLTR